MEPIAKPGKIKPDIETGWTFNIIVADVILNSNFRNIESAVNAKKLMRSTVNNINKTQEKLYENVC